MALCAALAFALPGCAGTPSGDATGGGQRADGNPPAEALRFVTDDFEYSGRSTGTEDGYYYVERGAGISANLRYIDYASAQDIFLSSRPEGNHFTPEDESYVSSVEGSGIVFPAGNELYLLRAGASGSADEYGQDAMAAVFVMGLDGSGRRQLYLGGAEEELSSTAAADGENLYLISRVTQKEDGLPVHHDEVFQLSRETGTKTTLCELPDGSWMIGASGRTLVFHSISATDSESGPPDMEHTILALDLDTREMSRLTSWRQEQKATAKVYEGKLVTAEVETMTITVQDLETGEVLNTFSMEGRAASNGTYLSFEDCHDGKFVFWNLWQATLWGIDLETGEWTAMTLTYVDHEKQDEPRPVQIYAETDTEFLVCRDYETALRQYGTPEGTAADYEKLCPCFALITKEDYWNSVPNFRDVVWNG